MTRINTLLPRLAATLAILVFAAAAVEGRVVRRAVSNESCDALTAFQQRVDAYAALHRRLAASLPPLAGRDYQSAAAGRVYLSSAIKTARATARQGDIFGADATRFFRIVIAEAMPPLQQTMFADLMDEDGRLLRGDHPMIHSSFPSWQAGELPASVVFMLPTLPPELEYRLFDYDLVLWDVSADLIVDVLPYVVPPPASDAMYR
jgi:hypothetical protein